MSSANCLVKVPCTLRKLCLLDFSVRSILSKMSPADSMRNQWLSSVLWSTTIYISQWDTCTCKTDSKLLSLLTVQSLQVSYICTSCLDNFVTEFKHHLDGTMITCEILKIILYQRKRIYRSFTWIEMWNIL